MHFTKKTNTVITTVFLFGLLLGLLFFISTVFTSFVKPFFLDKPKEASTISLNTLLDEAAEYIATRRDLTLSSPSATLTDESETEVTAEVINASGVTNAARSIADALRELGITVSRIGNSEEPIKGNVLSLKNKSLIYRDSIVSEMSTESGKVRVEKLDEGYPFDIRIVIGR